MVDIERAEEEFKVLTNRKGNVGRAGPGPPGPLFIYVSADPAECGSGAHTL